ncbi:hypothetical protein IFM89_019926 [Coptis chinensis]|uniref:Disease resistance R13L4/SHOC-2-like LRR domain-containing protein n=1 Tax=Coptis chinensis TaxID=261450 RepID=A0A835I3U2_9MAGN|nr:hypothetical protein IFM89_019926 [Coptis chinensis]
MYRENPSIYEAKKLRTLVAKLSKSVPSALHQLTCLRTLDLSGDLEVLPSEVSRLLHLRYLDLSKNKRLRELPETVRSLVNLQTLKLNRCTSLCKLPEGIGELSNLRHLEVEGTENLIYYPRGGIERLSQLRTLSKFVVSDGSSKGSVIGELGNLNFLKRSLSITGLRNVKSGNEAKEAQLQKKENISSLVLNFGYFPDIFHVSSEEEIRRMEGVLENLEPHKESLERLEIRNYVGSTLPTWMRMMSNITYLKLFYCPNLKVEPHYLFPPRLETLELWLDVGVLSKSLMSLTHNNNLKTLQIWGSRHSSLPQGLNQLTSLQQLTFLNCQSLDFKPEELKPLTMLRKLYILGCPIITRKRSREDWSILTHIPTINIDDENVKTQILKEAETDETYWEIARWNCVSEDDELFELKMDEAFHSFIFLLHVDFDGLDRAVMTMKKGEVVESTIALEYGFGSSEFKQELAVVTPNSTMKLSLNPLSSLQAEAKGLQTSRETMHKELENTNVRAFYRHAQAYIQLANLDLAGIDIKKVLEIDPNTKSSSVGSRSQALTVRCDMMDNCVHFIGCLLFTVYCIVCLVDVLVVRAATFLNLCSWSPRFLRDYSYSQNVCNFPGRITTCNGPEDGSVVCLHRVLDKISGGTSAKYTPCATDDPTQPCIPTLIGNILVVKTPTIISSDILFLLKEPEKIPYFNFQLGPKVLLQATVDKSS